MQHCLKCILLVFLVSFGAQAEETQPLPVLGFAQAYTKILQESLRVQTQIANYEIASDRLLASRISLGPSLAVVAGQSRTQDTTSGVNSILGKATLNLFRSGADSARISSALAAREREARLLSNEVLKAEDEAMTALVDVIRQEQEVEILRKSAQLKQESLDIARQRYDKGLLPLQEVEKVEIELDNAQARLTDSQNNLNDVQATLKTLLGARELQAEWPWKERLTRDSELLKKHLDLAVRPDWQATQFEIASADWTSAQAKRLLLPSVDLQATYGTYDLSTPDRRDWTVLLSLTIPIFDPQQNITTYWIRSLDADLARVRLESLRRVAEPQFLSLRSDLLAAQNSARAREKTLATSRKLFADSLQRFKLGRASVNDLAIDHDRLFSAELLAVNGWSAAHLAYARLCHSLGSRVRANGDCLPD